MVGNEGVWHSIMENNALINEIEDLLTQNFYQGFILHPFGEIFHYNEHIFEHSSHF